MSICWLRHKTKSKPLHASRGKDTYCYAVVVKGMKIERYEYIEKPSEKDRICAACQFQIAVERGKF